MKGYIKVAKHCNDKTMGSNTSILDHNIKKVKIRVHNPDDNTKHVEIEGKSNDSDIDIVLFGEDIELEVQKNE